MQFLAGGIREEGIQSHDDDQWARENGLEWPKLQQKIHVGLICIIHRWSVKLGD